MTDFLAIYLRDHHAAARAGVALAARAAASAEPSAPLATELSAVASQIKEDFGSLEAVMTALHVEPSRIKDALAAVGEQIGRVKANGRVIDRSPLSDVFEFESLCSGILAKEALWRSLSMCNRELPSEIDLDHLIERAQRQRNIVERCRLEAAQVAFGSLVDVPD